MFGGGRYDGLVAAFGVEPVPTVGFGMGDVTLQNFLTAHNLLPDLSPETDAVAILIGDVYKDTQAILADLRSRGLRLAVDATGRKLDAQIKSAVKSGSQKPRVKQSCIGLSRYRAGRCDDCPSRGYQSPGIGNHIDRDARASTTCSNFKIAGSRDYHELSILHTGSVNC